jgi:hypothetical protein
MVANGGGILVSMGLVATHWACVVGIASKAMHPAVVHHCATINIDAELCGNKQGGSDGDGSSSKGSTGGRSDKVGSVITRHLRSELVAAFLVSSGEVELE